MAKPLEVEYDPHGDVLRIDGMRFAGDFFRGLDSILPVGAVVRVEGRADGVVILSRLSQHETTGTRH